MIKRGILGALTVASLLAVGAIGYQLANPAAATAQAPTPAVKLAPTVTVADLAAAGFTNPTLQASSGSRFLPPVVYFRVKESSTDAGWMNDGVANLVAVTIGATPWSPSAVTNWLNVESDINGRSSVCSSNNSYYFCVIGPDKIKSGALVNALKTK
jgi:hypothetical protein